MCHLPLAPTTVIWATARPAKLFGGKISPNQPPPCGNTRTNRPIHAIYNITACGHMAAARVAKCLAANYHQTSHLLLFKY